MENSPRTMTTVERDVRGCGVQSRELLTLSRRRGGVMRAWLLTVWHRLAAC